MRIVLLALLTLVCVGSALAGAECLPLAPRNPDGNYIVPGVARRHRLSTRRGRELALDAYVQQGDARRPLVIVVHGGGWSPGSRVAFVGQLLETLTAAGFNWVSIDYRLPGKGIGIFSVDRDRSPMSRLRRRGRCGRGRGVRALPRRGAADGSGSASCCSARMPERTSPRSPSRGRPAGRRRRACSLGGFYDLRGDRRRPLMRGCRRKCRRCSPFGTNSAPVLAIHGPAIPTSPPSQAAAWCDAVRAAGGACERLMVNGASHRAENWWPRQWGYKRRMVEWLVSQLGDPGAHTPYRTRLRKQHRLRSRRATDARPLDA